VSATARCAHCGAEVDVGDALCRLEDLDEWLSVHAYDAVAWTIEVIWDEDKGYLVRAVTPA
jgi:hypothetical protein